MSILVIDVGTSGLRAAVVAARRHRRRTSHHRRAAARHAVPRARRVRRRRDWPPRCSTWPARRWPSGGPVEAVGITNQRASTVVWDRATGEPVGPGLGWQDLRTVGDCLTLPAEHGLRLAPNQSATKLAWLLDTHDPDRARDLCFGTVDTWLAWTLSERRAPRHRPSATPPSPGCCDRRATRLGRPRARDACASPASMLPDASSTRAASSARRPRSPARRRSPRSSATSRRR